MTQEQIISIQQKQIDAVTNENRMLKQAVTMATELLMKEQLKVEFYKRLANERRVLA